MGSLEWIFCDHDGRPILGGFKSISKGWSVNLLEVEVVSEGLVVDEHEWSKTNPSLEVEFDVLGAINLLNRKETLLAED